MAAGLQFCSADSRSSNSDSSRLRILASSCDIIRNSHLKASVTCLRHAKSLRRLMRNSSGNALVGMLVLAEGALGEGRIHVSYYCTVLEFCGSESQP